MGFLDLLGHAAIQAMRDAEKETKRHNQLCYQLSDYEVNLNNYLERVGCGAIYTADWGCIDTGSISLEKKKMDTISQKVEKYIELGGNPKYIHDLDEIDDCIEKVKYLKTKNALHRQQEFEYQESYWVKDDIECEEKEKREITRLLNAQGNELSAVVDQGECLFVPFYDVNDPEETIRVDIAKNYNEDTDQFLEYYTVSLKFNKSGYYVYSYDDQSSLYFKSSIGKNQSVEVASVPIPALRDWSMLVINGLELLCSTELADSVRDLYVEHNMSIIEEENSLSVLTASNINDLSGSEFERLCQKLIENMGFDTEITKESRDGGIDLIAYNHQPLLSGKYIIQCKRYAGSVGEPILRDLYGVVTSERANKGILMTTGYFTKSAITFSEGKPLELIDGKKMQELLDECGITAFDDTENSITPRDIFANNIMIEDEYDKYVNTINELDTVNDECNRANFINWLIHLTMGEFAEIEDFQEKKVIFREIKNQIRKYVDSDRIEKSKLLSYLYQMTYVQVSILLGDFNDAKDMFENLMQHKELQLSLMETIKESPDEVHITDFLYDHQGIFTWLCYTWYDMVQVAILVDDFSYKMHLTDHNLFYGYPVLEKDRLECTIAEIDSGIRTVGNKSYFVEKLNGFKEIDFLGYDEVPLKQLFIIDGYPLDVYYRYTYEDDGYSDFAPDFYKIELDGNSLKIDGLGNINNVKQKIQKWKKYQE